MFLVPHHCLWLLHRSIKLSYWHRMRNYQWRITDETRTIAGFECKKAVTKICDSVYVVAFYT
jgi:GLPGLI family protein